jgi:hypothetical protein
MPNVTKDEVQAWLENTRARLDTLEDELEASIATQVLSRIAHSYDTSGWNTPEATPQLVRTIIAMKYASWYYQRSYSEDSDTANDYALLLNANAETLIEGIISGANSLPEVEGRIDPETISQPAFYPDATDPGPVFQMGKLW